MKSESYVHAQLPHAGLGHMLLVWARACIFADIHNIPLLTPSWTKPHIGPILRREYSTRFYLGQFQSPTSVPKWKQWYARYFYPAIVDPEIVQQEIKPRTLYSFESTPHWAALFAGLQPHRTLLKNELFQMITPSFQTTIENAYRPCIAVHVRHGDFKPLSSNVDFKTVGATRTPLDYFIERIKGIRAINQDMLPVTIFSDGTDADLLPLLALPATKRAEKNADIVDMLRLSRAQLLIASAGSSFSYWAGFLSNAPLLLHPDHIHEVFRPHSVNQQFFEGGVGSNVNEWPELLIDNIRGLKA